MEHRNMRNIINKLNKATKAYDEGHPIISDKEWDQLYFQLENLEKETGTIYPDSPTQKIIFETVSKLTKVQHSSPMLSLDKTKDPDEVQNFVNRHDWFGMFKMDGLTARLTYINGILVGAETRGDGIEGENILHSIKGIKSVPLIIPVEEKIEIDGEIICKYSDFEEFKDEYKNPRNFAAGSIRQLNAAETASRNLTFVAWDLVTGYSDIDFFFWRLEKLDDLGFITVPRVGDAETVDDAISILNDMKNGEDAYKKSEYQDYPIDGYVFKFESVKYGKSLGHTDHHWRNAIAFKFYDEEIESHLIKIDYDVSRNGILTPVAVFEPIEIDGTEVSRSSLHNLSVMEETLGKIPFAGQKVWVTKSNQIIPQITRAEKLEDNEFMTNRRTEMISEKVICPICGSVAEIITSDSGVKNYYCPNSKCEGKLTQRIDYYAGKKGLDIKGISRKTIEKLVNWGFINELKDIYNLRQYQKEWESKPGFGAASVRKILNAIDAEGRHPKLESFISGIGIPLVGGSVSKEIVKYYSTWEDFRAAVGGDWTQFEGIGPEINDAINNFNYDEIDKIAEELEFKQPEIQKEVPATAALKDKIFCITGTLKSFKNRDELKNLIESAGGKVTSSISSKTDYLINNDITSTSSKNLKAKSLNIPIIGEDELMKMML